MQAGALTGHLEPLSIDNRVAIEIFNRCDGRIEFPNVLFHIARARVDDVDLMLERLFWIAEHQREVSAAQRAAMAAKTGG